MTKDDVKDVAIATVKGAVASIPFAGVFLSEYWSLAQEKIADRRLKEWIKMVENKIEKLDCDIQELSNDEMFYTAINIATTKALKEIHQEKRKYFANALYNSFAIESISEEKKLVFFNLLEKYTLISIKLLKLFSKNNHKDSDYIENSGGIITTTYPGSRKGYDLYSKIHRRIGRRKRTCAKFIYTIIL